MASVPTRIATRIANGIKKFKPILEAAKARDVGESDTVTIVVDILAEVLGFDKYSEITSEHSIRGTYCDLAIKIDGALQSMIEVKAIGLDLKDPHVKQAVDYAANQGVEWVLLTNGITWRVYKVTFAKPIDQELVLEIDFLALDHKSERDLETVFLLCKEGWSKSALGEFHTQKQALSRFYLGAMVVSDPVLQVIRRELRRLSPDVRIDVDEIREALITEVIKRDVIEGDKADGARRKIARSTARPLREKREDTKAEAELETQSEAAGE